MAQENEPYLPVMRMCDFGHSWPSTNSVFSKGVPQSLTVIYVLDIPGYQEN
jgi:hypothetical protein